MKYFGTFILFVGATFADVRSPEPASWPLATVFPGMPIVKESAPSADASYLARATVSKEGASYGLQRVVFRRSDAPRDVYTLYRASQSLFLKPGLSRLIEEEKITVCGYPALRYVLELEGRRRRVEFREVLIDVSGHFESYLFMHEYSSDAPQPTDAAAFFGRIEKRANQTPEPTAPSGRGSS
jgi:hypothetical protein